MIRSIRLGLTVKLRFHGYSGTIMTQPGKFGLGGGGLVVGHSGAEPVTDDYPGQRPWAFTGGTVKGVIIDVSGTPFVDLAREAAAAYARK
jgi:hypothetical protein